MQSTRNITVLQNKFCGYSWLQCWSERQFADSLKSANVEKWRLPKCQTEVPSTPLTHCGNSWVCLFLIYILTGYWICTGYLNMQPLLEDQEGFEAVHKCSLTTDNNNLIIFSTTSNAKASLKH